MQSSTTTLVHRTKIVNSGGGATNLGHAPSEIKVDKEDIEGILARLETLMVDKSIPLFLHDKKRLFKFKSIMRLAKGHLNSIKEKQDNKECFVDELSDGAIWIVGAIHSVPEDKHNECSQLISQFFTNGHALRPKQNDEVVERFLGICGYINFLEAGTNDDVYGFLWSLYAIRAMPSPSANTAVPSTTIAISPEKMKEIQRQQDEGVTEQEEALPAFNYDPVNIPISRKTENALTILTYRKGILTLEHPVVEEVVDTVEYTLMDWSHHYVKRTVDKPTIEPEDVKRTLVDSTGNRIKKKTGLVKKTNGYRQTYKWQKTGKKERKIVQREVAVLKTTKQSQVVNDKWKKTGNTLKQDYSYIAHEWEERSDKKLLYNKHTVVTKERPVHPSLKQQLSLQDAKGTIENKEVYETNDKCVYIDSYNLTAVHKTVESHYKVEKKVTESLEYEETVLDEEPIEWEDNEYVVEMQDMEILIDGWEMVLVEEEYNEKPHVTQDEEDVHYMSHKVTVGKFAPEEIEQIVWVAEPISKSVEVNTKVEKMVEKKYKLSDLDIIDEE